MATRQQAQRFMDLQLSGVDGLPGEPLQLGLYPPIEPPQQPMTLRQRQQQQRPTNQPVAPPTAQSYRQVMGADQFENSRAGAVAANRAAASLRAPRTGQPVAPPTAQNYRQIRGADSFGNSRAGAMEANRAADAMRAMRERRPVQMEQAELNSLRKRGGVPPDMAPRQGNAPGTNMVAGVDLNTSPVLGRRWTTDIMAKNAASGALPIQRSNPGARRMAQPGRTSFVGRSSSISRSNPGYTPSTDFARGFPQR